jgi:hypothetical protein
MPTPVDSREYARPGLLAETGWLADQLVDPRIRVVDARSAKEYAAAHIAGAVHLDGFGNLPRAENGDIGSAAEFATSQASWESRRPRRVCPAGTRLRPRAGLRGRLRPLVETGGHRGGALRGAAAPRTECSGLTTRFTGLVSYRRLAPPPWRIRSVLRSSSGFTSLRSRHGRDSAT